MIETKKGYWMVMATVTDPENYPKYIAANRLAFDKYGAKFLVRNGRSISPNEPTGDRLVVIEFDSYEKAVACYESPEYQAASKLQKQFPTLHLAVVGCH